ncbi:MAG TPA: tetratricopeptide repeat protein [Gemmataceae bacterium]|nr:tetratricopeptide repeat protein [Gemmataceae bacterium]
MWRIVGVIVMAIGLGGCAQDTAERLKAYNDDGLSLYSQGQFHDARESFEAALALKTDDPGLLYNIGQCYDHDGNAPQAEKYYQECLAHDPNHVAAHHALAKLLVRNQRMPDAVNHVQNWLTSSPGVAAAHAEDGWLWHEQGDLPKAQARLEQALLLDPHEWHALTELGLVYEGLRRPDRAVVLYEQSLGENPNQADVKARVTKLRAEGAGSPKPE